MDLRNDLRIALDSASLLRAAGLQPHPFQEAICRAEQDTLVLVCRQGGKSTAAGCAAAHRALYQPGSVIVIISHAQHQATEVRRKAEQFLRIAVPGLEPTSNTETRIELPNGSRVIALPADPATIRGYTAHLLLFDEAARVPNELFAAAQPMLAATGGRTIALTTPAGPRGLVLRRLDGRKRRLEAHPRSCRRVQSDFSRAPRKAAEQHDRRRVRHGVRLRVQRPDWRRVPLQPRLRGTRPALKPLFSGGW
jgi:terminase large subunit-like protein